MYLFLCPHHCSPPIHYNHQTTSFLEKMRTSQMMMSSIHSIPTPTHTWESRANADLQKQEQKA